MTNTEMLSLLNRIAPFEYAESWDNSGMIIDSGSSYDKVLIALDLTENVIEEAVGSGCGAVVCHHPAIFGGIKSIRWTDPVYKAVKAGLSVFAAHTNFDAADGGVNDVLASLLGLKDTVFMGDCRDGRIGTVAPCSAADMAETVKKALRLPFVELADAGREVTKVCVIGGSGGSFAGSLLTALSDKYGLDLDTPFKDLPKEKGRKNDDESGPALAKRQEMKSINGAATRRRFQYVAKGSSDDR